MTGRCNTLGKPIESIAARAPVRYACPPIRENSRGRYGKTPTTTMEYQSRLGAKYSKILQLHVNSQQFCKDSAGTGLRTVSRIREQRELQKHYKVRHASARSIFM